MDDATTYVPPTEERDTKDLAMLAQGMLRLTRCPGGRINANGFTCMHCGVDYTDSENAGFCGQPLESDGYTPFDATVARRIMQDSERKFRGATTDE